MPESLQDLELRRTEIAKQFARLGDLRSGSISNTSGRCGKPNCHCHQPGQPVHGPNPRLTFKVEGKTVSESLPTPAAQKKAEREIAEFRHFEQLMREFIAVNAKICHTRGVETPPLTQKKNDGRGLRKGRQPNRTPVATHLRRPPQDRPTRSGGGGDGGPFHRPPDRRGRCYGTATLPGAGGGPSQHPLHLWAGGQI